MLIADMKFKELLGIWFLLETILFIARVACSFYLEKETKKAILKNDDEYVIFKKLYVKDVNKMDQTELEEKCKSNGSPYIVDKDGLSQYISSQMNSQNERQR